MTIELMNLLVSNRPKFAFSHLAINYNFIIEEPKMEGNNVFRKIDMKYAVPLEDGKTSVAPCQQYITPNAHVTCVSDFRSEELDFIKSHR